LESGLTLNKDTLLFFYDEMRFGLISNYRRSWSPVGVRTIWDNQQQFQNRYLFTAISPINGESFSLIGFEENNSKCVNIFLEQMEKSYPNKKIVLVFDNAPSHRPKFVRLRKNITGVFLPSYSPELNPIERFFGEVRKSTANTIFKNIDEQELIIEKFVKEYLEDKEQVKKLTGYDWILKQWEEVCG
jgi:transposase